MRNADDVKQTLTNYYNSKQHESYERGIETLLETVDGNVTLLKGWLDIFSSISHKLDFPSS